MSRLLLVLASVGTIVSSASAATLVIEPAEFGSVNLDIDGDARDEFVSLGGPAPAFVVIFNTEPPTDSLLPGSSSRALFQIGEFTTMRQLVLADLFAGTAAVRDATAGFGGGGFLNSRSPVMGGWIWGTALNPNHLIGFVFDYREQFSDPGAPVTLYYQDYGPFSEGDSRIVSLAETGVPEPGGPALLGVAIVLCAMSRRRV